MTDSLLYALFTWVLTLASLIGSVRLLRSRRDAPWQVVTLWLIGTSLLGLSGAIGATYVVLTGTLAAGPIGALLVILRALATAVYVAVIIRFAVPLTLVDRVQHWWMRR